MKRRFDVDVGQEGRVALVEGTAAAEIVLAGLAVVEVVEVLDALHAAVVAEHVERVVHAFELHFH